MIYYPIQELLNFKKSDTCFVLGSGMSINDITPDQWDIIKEKDSLSMNNWIYHPFFVPDMYHLELKSYDKDIFQDWFNYKRKAYKNTNFIFEMSRADSLNQTITPHQNVFTYKCNRRCCLPKDQYPKGTKIDAKYSFQPEWILTKSFYSSLTTIIELLYRMDYKYIILLGIDLSNPLYFWYDWTPPKGLEYHHRYNKQHEHKDLTKPHNTIHVAPFIIDFNERYMKPNDREILLGTTKSVLYPGIKYVNIGDL
jgi:hypothetical protein